MLDYTDFGYKPDYGFELYQGDELIYSEPKVKFAVCFSTVFRCLRDNSKDEFRGIYTLKCRKQFQAQSGNYCSLEKSEIFKILRYMRKTFDIEISFKETDTDYVFDFTIIGKPIKHKFVLTFCRVFFEFPYNEFAKDVMRMRSMGKVNGVNFTHKSFLEVYHLIIITYMKYCSSGHSLFCYPNLDIKLSKLKHAFADGKDYVQDVYPGTKALYNKTLKNSKNFRKIDWTQGFEQRVEDYSKNFQLLKELKHEKSIRRRACKRVRKVD